MARRKTKKKSVKRKSKKAQGLSINVIILAALGIIILAIILFIVYGKIRGFGTGIEEIEKDNCKTLGTVTEENGKTYQYIEAISCPEGSTTVYGVPTSDIKYSCCRKELT